MKHSTFYSILKDLRHRTFTPSKTSTWEVYAHELSSKKHNLKFYVSEEGAGLQALGDLAFFLCFRFLKRNQGNNKHLECVGNGRRRDLGIISYSQSPAVLSIPHRLQFTSKKGSKND